MDAMFSFAVMVAIFVPVGAFAADIYRSRSWNLVFSHFWYFTLIWLVAFPLKALAIDSGFISTAARRALSSDDLTAALCLSFLLWVAVYIGNFWLRRRYSGPSGFDASELPRFWANRITVVLFLSVAISLPMGLWARVQNFGSNDYFSYRLGSGHLFLLAELIPLAVMATAIPALTAHFNLRSTKVMLLSFGLGVLASIPLTTMLASRRIVAACLLSAVVAFALRVPRFRWLVMLGVPGTVFGSIPLQAFRYARVPDHALDYDFLGKTQAFFGLMRDIFRNQVNATGSVFKSLFDSFEGIEHVAVLIKSASWQQLAFGVDHGLSWLFNTGLSLFPRALWSAKPVIYGNNAQQYFLYPEWFRDGLMLVAMPPSFVVDFVFGFGILGAVILAVMLGRVLRISENYLANPAAGLVQRALALFLFINVFNIVRSGTSIVQSLILYGIVVLIVYGWRSTVRGVLAYARTVFYRSRTAP